MTGVFPRVTHTSVRFLKVYANQKQRTPSPPSSEDHSRQKLPDSSATSCVIALNKPLNYTLSYFRLQAFFASFICDFRFQNPLFARVLETFPPTPPQAFPAAAVNRFSSISSLSRKSREALHRKASRTLYTADAPEPLRYPEQKILQIPPRISWRIRQSRFRRARSRPLSAADLPRIFLDVSPKIHFRTM